MDTMMTATPFRAEEITINCRVNPSWIRISILTLITTLFSWLAFGLFCSLVDGSLSFGQALVTPIALIFVVMEAVAVFIRIRNRDTEVTEHLSADAELA